MWSPASTDSAPRLPGAATPKGDPLLWVGVWVLLACLTACSSEPSKPSQPSTESSAPPQGSAARRAAEPPSEQAAGAQSRANPSTAPPAEAATAQPQGLAARAAAAPVVPPAAKDDFDRAVSFMRAGNTTEAELRFKQLALQYPQLAAPYVNLAILYRKDGHLDRAEEALQTAVEHNAGSAVAWTELGATQRMRGQFRNAAASYERAIAADPNFAPAYRNLGVVSDLYLGDPERALAAFERYKELTGEDKPVSGWIAELRQRTGKPVKPQAPAAAPSGTQSGDNPEPAADAAPSSNAGD